MTNAALGARRIGVDGARHELLARAAFAGDENRRTARRRLDDQVEDLLHPWTAADDACKPPILRLQRLLERGVLRHQLTPLDRVPHHNQHFVVLERLGDVVEGAELHGRDGGLDGGERGNHQHRQVVVQLAQLLQRGDAVETGHHHVDNRRVERRRSRQLQPCFAARRESHLIPLARQQRLEDLAHDLLVVDDEDRRGAARDGRGSAGHQVRCLAVIGPVLRHGGQRDGEARALADRAVAGDRAVVLAHDAVGDRQAEAGALADGFGGEERIVDARDVFARNPGARIGDFDDGAIALETGGNRQPAAARHRVLGIQEEIEEHLLQLVLHADDDHRRRRTAPVAPSRGAARTGARAG